METLLEQIPSALLSNSLLAVGLALIVAAVTKVSRNPHLTHALWLLVLVKLVTPPLVPVPIPGWDRIMTSNDSIPPPPDRHESRGHLGTPRNSTRTGVRGSWAEGEMQTAIPADESHSGRNTASRAAAEDRSIPETSERSLSAVDVQHAAVLFWAFGGVILLGVVGKRQRRLQRIIDAARDAGDALQADAAKLAALIGLGTCPRVLVTDVHLGPLALGGWRHQIVLLPQPLLDALTREQIQTVLAHEFAHIRRRDHWVRRLEIAALALHWWNPVAWWIRRQVHCTEEVCCDALVVSSLPNRRREYGQALLRTVEFLTEHPPAISLAGSGFGGSSFERRIEMIVKHNLRRGLSRVGGSLIAVLGLAVLPLAAGRNEGLPIRADAPNAATDDAESPAARGPAANLTDPKDEPEEDLAIPNRPRDPADVDAPLRLQVSRKNPPDWVIPSSREIPVFLGDGTFLVVGRDRLHFEIRDPADGQSLRIVSNDESALHRLRISHDRRRIAYQASPPTDPRSFVRPSMRIDVRELPSLQLGERTPIRFDGWAGGGDSDFAISPDGKTIAYGNRSGVFLWDVESGQKLRQAPHEAVRIDALAFSPDGRWLVISDRNDLTYWKWRTEEPPHSIHVGRLISSLAFTSDSRFLIEGPGPRTDIEIRDLETMQVVRRLKDETGHSMILNNMQLTDRGKTLVAGNDCGFDWRKVIVNDRIHFWDIETGAILRKFDFTRHEVYGVAVSPEGRYLLATIEDLDEVLLVGWDLTKPPQHEPRAR